MPKDYSPVLPVRQDVIVLNVLNFASQEKALNFTKLSEFRQITGKQVQMLRGRHSEAIAQCLGEVSKLRSTGTPPSGAPPVTESLRCYCLGRTNIQREQQVM